MAADRGGKVYTKSQRVDYALRGEELADRNVINFFVDTYEEPIKKAKRNRTSPDADSEIHDEDSDIHRKAGRRPNIRVRYVASHPKYESIHRVLRSKGHNALPNFIGQYFPRRDDPEVYPFYCACMLILLKPWRDIRNDLKLPSESWESAFQKFVEVNATKKIKNILAGIHYFHECSNAAQQARAEDDNPPGDGHPTVEHADELNEFDLGEDIGEDPDAVEYTEEGLARFIASQKTWREENHGLHAVAQARQAKIFKNDDSSWMVSGSDRPPVNATGDDLNKLLIWKEHMNADVNTQNQGVDVPAETDQTVLPAVGRVQLPRDQDPSPSVVPEPCLSEASLSGVDPSQLKRDQLRAYNIVTWHLNRTLAGDQPPPLRMIIHGEGGTGKSKVIQTITEYFAHRGAKHMLIKAAYTGVAASLIDGKTTHVIGMISRNSKNGLSDDLKAKLQAFWKYYAYLIIDEISMISKPFLAQLSRNIGIGKQKPGVSNCDLSFGGINVVFCGDFHQFPPVAVGLSDALYYPTNMARESTDAHLGRGIYDEFTTVVVLREQVRCTDPRWHRFLQNLRYGRVQPDDLAMLRSLVVTNPLCEATDFQMAPWDDAFLVTPRHAVRKLWNDAANRKHCAESGHQLFICPAEDSIKKKPLTMRERFCVAGRHISEDGTKKRQRDGLPDVVELAVGMKVMVTFNVQTDLDITNGARGAIQDIILHPDEPPVPPNTPVVKLTYLPSYVLVKLNRTRATQLQGLETSVVPIEARLQTFRINVPSKGKKLLTRTVHRRQYPVTAAYGFTDYRSQGQTLPYVLVDIASPPQGKLSLFNLYVALSRSSGRSTIRLLRDFKDDLFQGSHDTQLLWEDDRLDDLDMHTKVWWAQMAPIQAA